MLFLYQGTRGWVNVEKSSSSGPELIQRFRTFVGKCMRYFPDCPELSN